MKLIEDGRNYCISLKYIASFGKTNENSRNHVLTQYLNTCIKNYMYFSHVPNSFSITLYILSYSQYNK